MNFWAGVSGSGGNSCQGALALLVPLWQKFTLGS